MKKIKINQVAPIFSAKDYMGVDINLEQFRGKKVLLAFHAFASCPFCNLRVNETRKKQPEWSALGLEIIHVFPSSAEAITPFAGKDNPPFSIISDPDKKLYAQYGLEKSFIGMLSGFLKLSRLLKAFKVVSMYNSLKNNDAAMHQLPGDFLIDENGLIKQAYYAKNTSDNLPLAEISSYLNSSKADVNKFK